MVELSDEEKQRVFKLKTVEAKTYKQIQKIFEDEGRIISDNQIRETLRLGVHGSTELANQMRTDTQEQRRRYLNDLDEILKSAKDKDELVTAIGAINTGLKALEGIDRYEGRGVSPKTQINVLIVEREREIRNNIYDWLISNLPKDFLDKFQTHLEETKKIIEAKYKIVE